MLVGRVKDFSVDKKGETGDRKLQVGLVLYILINKLKEEKLAVRQFFFERKKITSMAFLIHDLYPNRQKGEFLFYFLFFSFLL